MDKHKRRLWVIEAVESRKLLSGTIYVDVNASGSTHNGSSWDSAYLDLQQAIAASAAGDEIHVADGTYFPSSGNTNVPYQPKSGVKIFGGYAGTGAADPNARNVSANLTVLSGDLPDSSSNSTEIILYTATDSATVLDGFTIAEAATYGIRARQGARPTISHCIFTRHAKLFNNASSPTVTDCAFVDNSSGGGAAMFNQAQSAPLISHCSFVNNQVSTQGGAINNNNSSPQIIDCTFTGNSAAQGGAIYDLNSNTVLLRCTFTRNNAFGAQSDMYRSGGAIYIDRRQQTGLFMTVPTACVFNGNSANSDGGGVRVTGFAQATLVNCSFTGNVAGDTGGGLRAEFAPLINCTFVDNVAGDHSGGADDSAGITNCIFWGNVAGITGASQIFPGPDAHGFYPASISYSDVQGGVNSYSSGPANINSDPQFVRNPSPGLDNQWATADDDYGDLRLRITSPCIDAGDNSVVTTTTDLAGNPRMVDVPAVNEPGITVDMGAYERVAPWADGNFLFDAPHQTVTVLFWFDPAQSSIAAADLVLVNLSTNQSINVGAFATVEYDPSSRTARWVFSSILPDGDYRATLPQANITDLGGGPALGSDLSFDFFVLGGDTNRDRRVDVRDLSILAANWQGSFKTFAQGDFNYDSRVNATDLGILSGNWQRVLSPPNTLTASLISRAATRQPARILTLVT